MAKKFRELRTERPGTREEMLETENFAEFLSVYAAAEGRDTADILNDSEALAETWPIFERSQKVAHRLKEVIRGEMERQFKIKLSPEQLRTVDSFLVREIVQNPDRVEALAAQAKDFLSTDRRIMMKEKKFDELSHWSSHSAEDREATVDMLAKVAEVKAGAISSIGAGSKNSLVRKFMPGFLARWDGREAALDEFHDGTKPGKNEPWDYDRVERDYTRADLEHQVLQFRELRQSIFEHLEPFHALLPDIRQAIAEQVERLAAPTRGGGASLKGFDAISDKMTRLQRWKKEGTELLGDRERVDDTDVMKKNFDDMFVSRIRDEIVRVVDNATATGKGKYSQMENQLKPILERRQIGDKTPRETKQFFIDVIKEKAQEIERDIERDTRIKDNPLTPHAEKTEMEKSIRDKTAKKIFLDTLALKIRRQGRSK